jgi:hypothetical protein
LNCWALGWIALIRPVYWLLRFCLNSLIQVKFALEKRRSVPI